MSSSLVSGALVLPTRSLKPRARPSSLEDDGWLLGFQRGDRAALARCYQDYVGTVTWAVRGVVRGVDAETVVHDVFCRLFGDETMRRNFQGGNFGAWLITVARRQAIDHHRRVIRETSTSLAALSEMAVTEAAPQDAEQELEFNLLVERFCQRVLPPKWEPVFRVRFLEQLDQRAAARRLGMHRTTLAYQELRIRALLRRFVLEEDR